MCEERKLRKKEIIETVLSVYERIGSKGSLPPEGMNFPTGADLAKELGYPVEILERVDPQALESFVGAAALPKEVLEDSGEKVVADLGCGAGVDSLWLGEEGVRVISMDMSPPMLSRLKKSLKAMKGSVAPLLGRLPDLPIRSETCSHAIMNGAANLVPDKEKLLGEVHRILRKKGKALIADVIILDRIDESLRDDPVAWAWCVGGALTRDEWDEFSKSAGFSSVSITVIEKFPPLGKGLIRLVKR